MEQHLLLTPLMTAALLLTAVSVADAFSSADVPVPQFTFEPGTINVAIPKRPGISLAAIHLTVNEPVHGTSPGKINKDLFLDGDVFRTTVHFQWQTGDIIYYWVYVVFNGLGYQRLEQSYRITARSAGPPRPPVRGPFVVPTPSFHFNPHVITVTVPALPGVTLAAIHLSLNERVPGTQAGRYNQDMVKSGNVFTTMVNAPWQRGDTIHYWVYMIYNGLGHHKLEQSYLIQSGPEEATPTHPAPPPSPPVSSVLPEECGTRFFDDFGDPGVVRVVNAPRVETFDYPWQAQIRTTRSQHVCGGIIISDRHILTAAHCLTGYLTKDLEVVVGQNDLDNKDPEEEVYAVDYQFSHIGFGEAGAGRYLNDIALILLRTSGRGPIKFGDYIRPACLPSANQNTTVETACLISGWGRTSTELRPRFLHGSRIPYVSSDFCSSPEVWGGQFNGSGQLCAGDVVGGVDACEGDSGGPLACQDERGRWHATGIVSWGSDQCGLTRRVGVYTRVSSYVGWISHVLENVFGFQG